MNPQTLLSPHSKPLGGNSTVFPQLITVCFIPGKGVGKKKLNPIGEREEFASTKNSELHWKKGVLT